MSQEETIDNGAQEGAQNHQFQAEVSQLLKLMIHSLYSNQEIFLRELIANASDAIDKRRFLSLQDDQYVNNEEYVIDIDVDADQRRIVIRDNGIGMSHDDVIANLGTIAKSGTAEFLAAMQDGQKADSDLIGQFGVGFYSAFIVADKVTVLTRKADEQSQGIRWESDGEGEFSVEETAIDSAGTRVILHIREDCSDFLDEFRLRSIVKKYADHLSIPVRMLEKTPLETSDDSDDKPAEFVEQYQQVNNGSALWTRSKSDISDEEYINFYQSISHDWSEPLHWSHNKVEGKLDYQSVMYIPGKAPMDLYQREGVRGLKLFIQKVFILDNAEQFLPLYLRFVKGVLDTNDLDLNVSREILQQSPQVDSLRKALTARVLDMLKKLSKEQEKYSSFWQSFGQVIKEGLGEDTGNQEKIAQLLRYETTSGSMVSLADYVERMVEGQKSIYYITSSSIAAAKNSPQLEAFQSKGIEVIYMVDPIDEWAMSYLTQFEEKSFVHIARAGDDLDELATDEEKQQHEEQVKESEDVVSALKAHFEQQLEDVKLSTRLTSSAACLVEGQQAMGKQLREMLKAAGQEVPEQKPILEINASHELIEKLQGGKAENFAQWADVLLANAYLADGELPPDTAAYLKSLNQLLGKA